MKTTSPVHIRWADGREDMVESGTEDARGHIQARHPHAVFVEEDDRILVWSDTDDAGEGGDGDDGAHAIAVIVLAVRDHPEDEAYFLD